MTPKPQRGILDRPPDHLLLIALNLNAGDAAAAATALGRLRGVVEQELTSDLDETTPASPKDVPSAETGELGFSDGYDRSKLSITMGLGATAFDKLGVAAEDRPQDLKPIPWAQLGDAAPEPGNGDVVLQVCSDSEYVAEHVLRHVEQDLAVEFTIAWVVEGHQRHGPRCGAPSRDEGRALIGFLDGTSNLRPRSSDEDRGLVLVDPDRVGEYPALPTALEQGQESPYGGTQPPAFPPDLAPPPASEPQWAREGSYMVVRASTINATVWDGKTLDEQEKTIGRWKVSGSALGTPDDPAVHPPSEPDLLADPDGATTPLNAHIRKSNPRGPGDELRRIFRRGYPMVNANISGMQRGLVFVCFGRTISTQFEFITRAWTTNENFPRPGTGADPLRQLETVLCGGYFFVPAIGSRRQPWSWVLPVGIEAAAGATQ